MTHPLTKRCYCPSMRYWTLLTVTLLACSSDAQLRRERLASPDCQRRGADPDTCGGMAAAKASKSDEPSTTSRVLGVVGAGLGGFLDGASRSGAGGCVNSYSCPPGLSCVVPQGATMGSCADIR